jgi:hypothetical protein
MGIRVHLAIDADRVSDDAWRRVYEQARRVAKQWIPRPLSTSWRRIGTVQVAQYCQEIETAEGLHIVGDAEMLTIGESFVFPVRLERGARRDVERDPDPAAEDVLVAVARWHTSETERGASWRDLFGAKTQGLPYHKLIVALGLLVEHSLPGAAVVYGDFSARDGERARRGVSSILDEELELPVVTDVERLRHRLAGSLPPDALDRAIRYLGPPNPHHEVVYGDLLGLLRTAPEARVRHELEQVVLSCPDPDGLHVGTRQVLRGLVEAIQANAVRWEVRARAEQWGADRTREELAYRTRTSGMRLTSMAWDAIEAADLDELAFLYVAACMDTSRLEVHQAVRALLENRALRRS